MRSACQSAARASPAVRGACAELDRPAGRRHRVHVRRAGRRDRALRGGAGGVARRPRRARRDLPRQALRDGGRIVRCAGARRGVRADQSAAEGRSRSPTSCATATCACSSPRPSGCRRCSARAAGLPGSAPRDRRRRSRGAASCRHARSRCIAGTSVAARRRRPLQPPRDRHRHRGILYTSGSTGKPKGVVLSHRNMVAGAKSVASLPRQPPERRAARRAAAVVRRRLQPADDRVPRRRQRGAAELPAAARTWSRPWRGIASPGSPPCRRCGSSSTQVNWPDGAARHLRYFANTGGRMPLETLKQLRALLPQAKPYLMYGLTEAFRATYLPPEEVDRRPDSIGKAIPNAEILVLRPDGTPCDAGEPGELVQRGALVAQGYWNDAGEDGRALPAAARARAGPDAAGDRGVLRRHGAPRRGGLSVLRRPARRDDQVLGLSHQPDRGRGGALRHADWSANARRSACRIRRSARWSSWS